MTYFEDQVQEISRGFLAEPTVHGAGDLCEDDLCLNEATAEFQGVDEDGCTYSTFTCDDHQPDPQERPYVRLLTSRTFECRLEAA